MSLQARGFAVHQQAGKFFKKNQLGSPGGGGGEFLLLGILSLSYHSAPTVEGPGSKQRQCEPCWFHPDPNLGDSLDISQESRSDSR